MKASDHHTAPADGTAAALVNGERAVVLAWPRAILLQVAHPLVAAGVAEHSRFAAHLLAPVTRLHGTIRAMLALTFGTPSERAAAAARINAIHDRVNGTLRVGAGRWPAGTAYSAHDPALLAWVHVTLVDSMLLGYRQLVAPLPVEIEDAYCREAAEGARLLGVPDALLPLTAEGVQRAVRDGLESEAIAVGDDARTVASAVIDPSITRLAWPVGRWTRAMTTGLLPPAMREAYGLPWTPREQRAYDRASRLARRWSRLAPTALRRWRAARQ